MTHTADAFNAALAERGDIREQPVRYWTGARQGDGKVGTVYTDARTREEFGSMPVIFVRDCHGNNVGAVALSHVELATTEDLADYRVTAPYRKAYASPEADVHDASTYPDIYGDLCTDPAEDEVRWDLGMGGYLAFADDREHGRGLSGRISVGCDFPKSGTDQRGVTPDQVRAFAMHLIALVDRHERRTASKETAR